MSLRNICLTWLLFVIVVPADAGMNDGLPNLGTKFEEEIGKWIKEGESIALSVELLEVHGYSCTSVFERDVIDCVWTDRAKKPMRFRTITIRLVGREDIIEVIYSTMGLTILD